MANFVITIGREYATGGYEISDRVAEALGIKVYDRELITMAAKESGLSEQAVAASEKQRTHSLLYSLYTMGNDLPLGDQVFIYQSRIIKQLAEQESCIILGRCGDYVLREHPNVLRVFIHAPMEYRMQIVKAHPSYEGQSDKQIIDMINKTDKDRASYYNYYTQNRWGDVHNYDLVLNAALGEDACVEMLLCAAHAKKSAG